MYKLWKIIVYLCTENQYKSNPWLMNMHNTFHNENNIEIGS